MPFETVNEGIELTIPTSTTTNWGNSLKNLAWKILSGHRHEGSGDGNQIRTAGLADGAVTNDKLADAIKVNQSTVTPAGTTQTIDFATAGSYILDLSSATGDVTVTLSNPITAGRYRIKVVQGATQRTVVWPAAVLWAGGADGEPTQHQNVNTVNYILLDYDGTNYLTLWDNELS